MNLGPLGYSVSCVVTVLGNLKNNNQTTRGRGFTPPPTKRGGAIIMMKILLMPAHSDKVEQFESTEINPLKIIEAFEQGKAIKVLKDTQPLFINLRAYRYLISPSGG